MNSPNQSHETITCNICPEACCSWKTIPACNPEKPGFHFAIPVAKPDYHLSDFFGQFIKETATYQLHANARTRFLDCRTVRCPKCGHYLPLNPSSDGYLLCAFCNVNWDLLMHRPIQTKTEQAKQMVLL